MFALLIAGVLFFNHIVVALKTGDHIEQRCPTFKKDSPHFFKNCRKLPFYVEMSQNVKNSSEH